jgi:hypothetical protein
MTDDPETDERSTERTRRALLGLGAVASVAVLAAPKNAEADLLGDIVGGVSGALGGVLGSINGALGGIKDILGVAFSLVVSLSIPTSFQEIIQCLLGGGSASFNFNGCSALRGLLGGPFQILRTGSIEPHMEEIWPSILPETPTAADEQIKLVYEATKTQVASSQAVTAGLAEAQVQLGLEDTVTLEELNGAAALGSIITVAALIGKLQFTGNQRLAMIIQALNAQQQTHGNRTMRAAHDKYLEVLSREMQREPSLITNPGVRRLGG